MSTLSFHIYLRFFLLMIFCNLHSLHFYVFFFTYLCSDTLLSVEFVLPTPFNFLSIYRKYVFFFTSLSTFNFQALSISVKSYHFFDMIFKKIYYHENLRILHHYKVGSPSKSVNTDKYILLTYKKYIHLIVNKFLLLIFSQK